MTINNAKAYKLHEKHLTFLDGYIVFLVDLNLNKLTKELVSVVISTAIDCGQRIETLSYLQENPKIPKTAKFNFKLTSSTKVAKREKYKCLKVATTKRIEEME